MNDVIQFENDFVVQTKTRHRTPIVRTTSITNVDESNRHSTVDRSRVARIKRASIKHLTRTAVVEHESGSSSPDGDAGGLLMIADSDSSPDDGAYITQLLPTQAHATLLPSAILSSTPTSVTAKFFMCSSYRRVQFLRLKTATVTWL